MRLLPLFFEQAGEAAAEMLINAAMSRNLSTSEIGQPQLVCASGLGESTQIQMKSGFRIDFLTFCEVVMFHTFTLDFFKIAGKPSTLSVSDGDDPQRRSPLAASIQTE